MENRAYHGGIEAMFGQPMKAGLKTSNLPDDAIDYVSAEEELVKIISGQNGDDPTKDLTVEENDYQILLMLRSQYWNSSKKHVRKMCHPQKW